MELDPGIHIVMHSVLSLKTGCDKLSPGLDGSWGEVHEPSPGWPGQGYMEVTCHNGIVAPSCRDGGDVYLQEF
jgi:hypothetical protein